MSRRPRLATGNQRGCDVPSLYPSRIEVEAVPIPEASQVLACCRLAGKCSTGRRNMLPPPKSSDSVTSASTAWQNSRWSKPERSRSSNGLEGPSSELSLPGFVAVQGHPSMYTPRGSFPHDRKAPPSNEKVGSYFETKIPPTRKSPRNSEQGESRFEDEDHFCNGPHSRGRLDGNFPPAEHTAEQQSNVNIEIFPGCFLPLLGSKATERAMQDGRISPACCFACAANLYCMNVADYVLCPTCRVVSPVEWADQKFGSGGVGLGILADHYEQWRQELQHQDMDKYQRFL